MNKEVVQKKFQRGMLGIIAVYSFLGVLVTCFCVTRVEPNVIHHISREQGDWAFFDFIGMRGDAYVIPTHNLAKGTVLKDKDIKVVIMPALKGYEKAFGDADDLIGRTTAHAVPEGQPVLPYHLSDKSKRDSLVFDYE